jgi:hypothetical protein
MTTADKQHAHELLERIPADQMIAAVRFLEFLVATTPAPGTPEQEEDEEISQEEEQAVARSKEWFQHNNGIPFEQVVADLGFSMEQIRAAAATGKEPSA